MGESEGLGVSLLGAVVALFFISLAFTAKYGYPTGGVIITAILGALLLGPMLVMLIMAACKGTSDNYTPNNKLPNVTIPASTITPGCASIPNAPFRPEDNLVLAPLK